MMGVGNVWLRDFTKGPECVFTWQVGFFFCLNGREEVKWSDTFLTTKSSLTQSKTKTDMKHWQWNITKNPSICTWQEIILGAQAPTELEPCCFCYNFYFYLFIFDLKEELREGKTSEWSFVSGCNERVHENDEIWDTVWVLQKSRTCLFCMKVVGCTRGVLCLRKMSQSIDERWGEVVVKWFCS